MSPRTLVIDPNPDREDFLATCGDSHRNLNYKRNCLDAFLRYCDDKLGHRDLKRVTKKDIKRFAMAVASKIGPSTTKAGKLRLLSNWFRWLSEQKRIPENPSEGLDVSAILKEAAAKRPGE